MLLRQLASRAVAGTRRAISSQQPRSAAAAAAEVQQQPRATPPPPGAAPTAAPTTTTPWTAHDPILPSSGRLHNSWGETDRHDGWRSSNWACNVRWPGADVAEPGALPELQEAVLAADKVRVVGSTHSFSPLIAAQDGTPAATLVSLRRMPAIFDLDPASATLTVDAGSTYSEICAGLSRTPFALPNTAAIPQVSLAGAVATGSHGSTGLSGDGDGRLALSGLPDAVVALEMVGADGEVRRVRRGDADFQSSVVSLGLLGVVTKVTLQLVETFDVRQRVYGGWPALSSSASSIDTVLDHLPEILADCGSFSAYLDWCVDDAGMLILRDFVRPGEAAAPAAPEWRGAPLRTDAIQGFLDGADLEATGRGRWHDKLHCFMADAVPTGPQSAAELQFEHFVPLKYAREALEVARTVGEHWGGALMYCELRAVRGDDHELAPYSCGAADGHDTLAIAHGMHAKAGQQRILQAAAILEEGLAPFAARPHWGKLTAMTPADIRQLYGARLARFRAVRERHDPARKFSHAWLDRMLLDDH